MSSTSIKRINIFIAIAIILVALPVVNTLEFSIKLTAGERFCFYQVFEMQQKYTFTTSSPENANHEVEVSHIYDKSWKSIFYKSTAGSSTTVRVDKLASQSTTYSFCIKSTEQQDRTYKLKFSTGLQMLELSNLPDASDSQNMQRQLSWLQQQLAKLSQKAENIEMLRRVNSQIHGMVGVKMIIFGVIGLIGIGVVNFVFFRLLKAEFRKRKFI